MMLRLVQNIIFTGGEVPLWDDRDKGIGALKLWLVCVRLTTGNMY
jgi:hypothetical protein